MQPHELGGGTGRAAEGCCTPIDEYTFRHPVYTLKKNFENINRVNKKAPTLEGALKINIILLIE